MTNPDVLGAGKALEAVRAKAPLVHNITNYVVMNTSANALLALGASPVMAHAEEEMEAMVGIASALVINIGTLSRGWVAAMHAAGGAARDLSIPIVLDPVGAGATPYRTAVARELLAALRPAILRGNASEIQALAGEAARTKGVDATAASSDAMQAARALQAEFGCAVAVSGEVDHILAGDKVYLVRNGHPLMPRVTGLGCTATALCGAFAAVTPDPGLAAAQAMAVMGVAGEMAAERAEGPGTLQLHFLDALYRLDAATLAARMRVEA
ncbi:MAG TPA: hydroxyethylthiazole kinase [Holophaga sp.]|nr:hydroxyethylthiazole kinase [Holophaga sp.]